VLEVRLRYFEGCPHWQTMDSRLREVLREEGLEDIEPILERVETDDDAQRLRFIGSPTVLINGQDPFAGDEAAFGLTCRIYQTPEGLAGTPTPAQLREVLRAA
jgi:uracil DNA glycosylase